MIIAHGIDVVDVARVASMLDAHGQRFLDRCFTVAEQEVADVNSPNKRAERLAARYAAKEAVLKALGTGLAGGIEWIEIGVVRENGPPSIELRGRAAEVAADQGITEWHLSLSHTHGIAMASVIAIGDTS